MRKRTPPTRIGPLRDIVMIRRFRVGKSWGAYVLVDMQRKVESFKSGAKYVRYGGAVYKLGSSEQLAEFVRDARAKGRKVRVSGTAADFDGEAPALSFFKEWLKPVRSY